MLPFPNRRKFSGLWEEIKYLYFKAGYWMYERGKRRRATSFVRRLKDILINQFVSDDAILAVEAKGLIADFEGNKKREIHFKKLEIQLLTKLSSQPPRIRGYDWSRVLSEMSLLATLFEEDGQRAKALKQIEECKAFARRHRLKFHDGEARRLIWRNG
jgi:hypothetical protein